MKEKNTFFWVVLIFPYLLLITGIFYHNYILKKELEKVNNSKIVIINKENFSLTVYSYTGEKINEFDVALGANYGNKKKVGDNKTPEGIFNIVSIEDASNWAFDFTTDNEGPVVGAYGPYFFRLNVPDNRSIGIHGTNDNNSIKYRSSHGCIRMKNEDLLILKNEIDIGTTVIIVPSSYDLLINNDTTDLIEEMLEKRLNHL